MDGLVDLHSHVIPGIDDGARDDEESLELLRGLERIGYVRVVATPHARPGLWDPPDGEVRTAHAALRERARTAGIALDIDLGAEHYWDARLFQVERERLRPHQDGPALLLEVPTQQTPSGLEQACFKLRVKGLLPLLAHPERYADLCGDVERVTALAEKAAFIIDLGSLVGSDGRDCEKAAQWLLKKGFAKAVATDVHRADDDLDQAEAGLKWIHKKLGAETLYRLARDNPQKLLAGEWPD